MGWVEIDLTQETKKILKKLKIHCTPIGNIDSIRESGLLRPDIVHNKLNKNEIVHFSPYKKFKSSINKPDTEEKRKYIYFGEWNTNTFKEWVNDDTFINNNLLLILTEDDYLKEKHDKNNLGRYRSGVEFIPYDKFIKGMVINEDFDKEKIDKDIEILFCFESGKLKKVWVRNSNIK